MSSNFLPRRKQPTKAPPIVDETLSDPTLKPKKPRKMNIGNQMRKKNKRMAIPV